jgi:hypothetical protein
VARIQENCQLLKIKADRDEDGHIPRQIYCGMHVESLKVEKKDFAFFSAFIRVRRRKCNNASQYHVKDCGNLSLLAKSEQAPLYDLRSFVLRSAMSRFSSRLSDLLWRTHFCPRDAMLLARMADRIRKTRRRCTTS